MPNLTVQKAQLLRNLGETTTSLPPDTRTLDLLWQRCLGDPKYARLKPALSAGIPQSGRDRAILVKEWNECLDRGAQAWLCVHASLAVDPGLPYAVEDQPAGESVRCFALMDVEDLLLKFVKENSVYCAAKGLGQSTLNEASCTEINAKVAHIVVNTNGHLAGGWVARRCDWIMAPMRKPSPKFKDHKLCAAQNVLYMKRGMPCMRKVMVREALKKHMVSLTTPHILGKGCEERHAEVRERIAKCVTALCRDVFGGLLWVGAEVFPSSSAAYCHSRGCGGPLGKFLADAALAEEDGLDGGDDVDPELRSATLLCGTEFHSMREINGKVHEFRYSKRAQALFERFSTRVGTRVLETLTKPVEAKPMAVCEPCKVRVVTLGEPEAYQRALPLQRMMHDRMRKLKLFQFIGKPIDEESWAATFRRNLTSTEVYVSGDYEAATDNLDPFFSELVWTEICRNVWTEELNRLPVSVQDVVAGACGSDMDDGAGGKTRCTKFLSGYVRTRLLDTPWYDLGIKCLTGHLLDYSSVLFPVEKRGGSKLLSAEEEAASMIPQKWGQLMGSPMSFPVLNLVNAAASAVGLGWVKGSVLGFLEQFGCRTNGDDIVFRCEQSQLDQWEFAVRSVGLSPSLGKNYSSRDFAIMNSQLRVQDTETGEWTPVGFLNLPLLFGLCAKGPEAGCSVTGSTAWFEMAPVAHELVRWCPDTSVQTRRLSRFCDCWEETLRRIPPGVAYDFPIELGGAGLPSLPWARHTEGEYHRAAWLACLDTEKRLKEVTPPKLAANSLWEDLMSLALKRCEVRRIVRQKPLPWDAKEHTTRPGAVLTGLFAVMLNELVDLPSWHDFVSIGWVDERRMYGCCRDAAGARLSARLDKTGQIVYQPERERKDLVLAAERTFRDRIMKQNRLTKTCSLSPMDPETVAAWSDDRELVEIPLVAGYQARASFD